MIDTNINPKGPGQENTVVTEGFPISTLLRDSVLQHTILVENDIYWICQNQPFFSWTQVSSNAESQLSSRFSNS